MSGKKIIVVRLGYIRVCIINFIIFGDEIGHKS